MEPIALSAAAAAAEIAAGSLSAEDLTRALIDRIQAAEPTLHAWAFIDPEHALRQARAADLARKTGQPLGPLHGVPIAVDDLIDTADQPTALGTPIHAGRRPDGDATAVLLLRAGGATIFGKTAVPELGAGTSPATVNPHDPARAAGGSSPGAAAAVAAAMAPAALALETAGSIVGSAAHCGVCGFKPTHGLISLQGMLDGSRTLGHAGVIARTVEDLALVAETLMAYDPGDPDMRPHARSQLHRIATSEPPLPPRFCVVRAPGGASAGDDTQAGLAELTEFLGPQATEVSLPAVFDTAVETYRKILEAELAATLSPEHERAADRLSPALQRRIAHGLDVRATDYLRARATIARLNAALSPYFEAFDAILAPAAAGEAPLPAEDGTDLGALSSLWALCGLPAVSLPLLQGASGLPLGIQLVGPRGDDARLLRSARWLAAAVLTPKSSRKPAGRRRA